MNKFKTYLKTVILACGMIYGCLCNTNAQNLTESPERKTMNFGGFEREYLIYRPENTPNKPSGIIVGIHGYNRTMTTFFTDIDIRSLADSLNYLIIAPQALPEQSQKVRDDAKNLESVSGQSFPLDAVWGCGLRVTASLFSVISLMDDELNSDIDDKAFINTLINNILSEFKIENKNIFMLGTSMGAYMSYQYAIAYGQRLSGLIPIAGTMGTAIKGRDADVQVPICDFHSLTDEVVPYTGSIENSLYKLTLGEAKANVINLWVEKNGAGSPQIEDFPTANNITVKKFTYPHAKYEVVHYQMNGANHSYIFAHENGDEMDYREEILKFVARHSETDGNSLHLPETQILAFYPNPVSDEIRFSTEQGNFTIYNIAGKAVMSKDFRNATSNISGLEKGIYLIKIQSDGFSKTSKLIKE